MTIEFLHNAARRYCADRQARKLEGPEVDPGQEIRSKGALAHRARLVPAINTKSLRTRYRRRREELVFTDEQLRVDWGPVLEKAGVDGLRRAETLSGEEFAAIERALG